MQRKTETSRRIFLALFPSGGEGGVGAASGVLATSSGCFVLGDPSSFRSETLGGVSGRVEAMVLAWILRVKSRCYGQKNVVVKGWRWHGT